MNIFFKIKRLFLSETSLAISEIKKLSKRDIILVEHSLNRWKFPDQLKHIKPSWWDEDVTNDRKRYHFNRPVMSFCDSMVTKKEMFHYHIVECLGNTEDYFNDWWESSSVNPNRTKTNPIEEMAMKVFFNVYKDKKEATIDDFKNATLDVTLKEADRVN